MRDLADASTHARMHACTHALCTHACINACMHAGKQAGRQASANTHRSMQAGPSAGAQGGTQAGTRALRNAGTQAAGRQAGRQARRQAGTQARRQAGTQARRHAGTQSRQLTEAYAGTHERQMHARTLARLPARLLVRLRTPSFAFSHHRRLAHWHAPRLACTRARSSFAQMLYACTDSCIPAASLLACSHAFARACLPTCWLAVTHYRGCAKILR